MKTVVSVSGGLGSAWALKQAIEQRGKENVIAVFADVKGNGYSHYFSRFPHLSHLLHEWYGGESRDTYRFLWQLSHYLDIPIERIESERTIWTVFAEKRALRLVVPPRTFFCPASEQLKRMAMADWLQERFPNGGFDMALGMKWDEQHRIDNSSRWWSSKMGYEVNVWSPLVDGMTENHHIAAWLHDAEIDIPASYAEGFEHNNCGGGCVHAGLAHWANLYMFRRDVYMYWAWMENQIQDYVGKPVTILKSQRGGVTLPISLYAFIDRIERGDYPRTDWGGCGCFTNASLAIEMSKPQPVQLELAI